ncbi:MAG: transposase [Gammaproteobacteria bacterium]
MSGKRYDKKFKKDAVKQVTERGYSVAEEAQRLGITTHNLYAWMKKYGKPNPREACKPDAEAEIAKLKSELNRATMERDILKRPPTLPMTTSKVCLHLQRSPGISDSDHVQGPQAASQWFLCLAA